MSTSSRLFVRGLPPSYSEDEFRSHFSEHFNITDIRYFPQRRIGYVGLKTPQDAKKAARYFDKSFIRMSRIRVELAHGVTQTHTNRHPTSNKFAFDQQPLPQPQRDGQNSLKRKRESTVTVGIAQASSVHPDRAKQLREDIDAIRASPEPTSQIVVQDSTGVEESGARRKTSTQNFHASQKEVAHDEEPSVAEGFSDETGTGTHGVRDTELQSNGSETNDTTWMRSRTSRLFGLADEEDDTNDMQATQPTPARGGHETTTATETHSDADESHAAPRCSPSVHEALPMVEDHMDHPETNRLFIRNLLYTVEEEDLRGLFEAAGAISEVQCPRDPHENRAKGFAFVSFANQEDARRALEHFDGMVFQGRILHVLPAAAKREPKLNEFTMSQLSLKKRKLLQKRAEAGSSTFNWNSLYMNPDAVVSSVAARLGLSKSELLDPSSSNSAVKQAQAETHVIQETKDYFRANGINLAAFTGKNRDSAALLVKNFPFTTKVDEMRSLFSDFGEVVELLMPPTGTIAIVRFAQKEQAVKALKALSYRKFKTSVLFLERAPVDLFVTAEEKQVDGGGRDEDETAIEETVETNTVFVRNLSFATTNERFRALFEPLDGFISARVKTKPDPKRNSAVLSMGFGFLEFRTKHQAQAAIGAMNGYSLDGHTLELKASHKGHDKAEERRRSDKAKQLKDRSSKIIIKNVPFEASKDDLRNLFKAYGQLRTMRLPKKVDNSRKGFAFAEFTSPREAENALEALRNTHLLGRRLVLEFASGEADDPEAEIEEMQRKVSRHSNSLALQRLSKSERKKFMIDEGDDRDANAGDE